MDNKATLAEVLWNMMAAKFALSNYVNYVILDGGALSASSITWNQNITYHELCPASVAMLLYPNMAEQLCLIQTMQHKITPLCADVQVTECMVFEGNKDELLSKVTKKQIYTQLSADSLEKSGCDVEHVGVKC